MSDLFKRMDLTEFRESGYLQEINRRFLHPLGLALEMRHTEDGGLEFHGVWDCREDPGGIHYEGFDFAPKARSIERIEAERRSGRIKELGYWVQPVDDAGAGGPEKVKDEYRILNRNGEVRSLPGIGRDQAIEAALRWSQGEWHADQAPFRAQHRQITTSRWEDIS